MKVKNLDCRKKSAVMNGETEREREEGKETFFFVLRCLRVLFSLISMASEKFTRLKSLKVCR